MSNLPRNLADVLRKGGLKVVEIPGWQDRGRPRSTGGFAPVGVLNHHTGAFDGFGDAAQDLDYAKWMFLQGRSDLPAPLCHLALSAEGVVYLGAAGRANHAGTAKASGSVAQGDGNYLYIGIEWMLSGTQPIPKGMYEAGVLLNALLCEHVTGNSVQTISCHYQTSVTGKWDIGDPNGVPFRGHKVLNVGQFRDAVKQKRKALNPPKVKTHDTLRLMHASLQFSDTNKQKREDIEAIFGRAEERKVHWITGTEAGPGADPTGELLLKIGRAAGYRLWVPSEQAKKGIRRHTDAWIAVNRDLIAGGWKRGYRHVIPGSSAYYESRGIDPKGKPRWAPKGIVRVAFNTEHLGRINVGAAHYLVRGRPNPKNPAYGVHTHLNRALAEEIGEWARKVGKGSALVFYGGDQNINDRHDDTFFGSPLTSAWDELEKWRNTGHGNIDVIASYDRDARVEALRVRRLTDKKFPLHTDHFLVEAEYRVRRIKD